MKTGRWPRRTAIAAAIVDRSRQLMSCGQLPLCDAMAAARLPMAADDSHNASIT